MVFIEELSTRLLNILNVPVPTGAFTVKNLSRHYYTKQVFKHVIETLVCNDHNQLAALRIFANQATLCSLQTIIPIISLLCCLIKSLQAPSVAGSLFQLL